MGIHQARNALSSAHQGFAEALNELEKVIATRGTYETICEDPLSGHQTYTVDAGRRKGLLAAGAFLETLARADEGLVSFGESCKILMILCLCLHVGKHYWKGIPEHPFRASRVSA